MNGVWISRQRAAAEIAITYKRTGKNKVARPEYKQTWQCKTYKRQQVTVPAGSFDTIKVIFRTLTKTGQFVKRVMKYRHASDKTWELVSFRKAPRR